METKILKKKYLCNIRLWYKPVLFWVICYVMTFGRYLYQGFQYYLQTDDYVQIGIPNTMTWWAYLQYAYDVGLTKGRWLANVLDRLFWSRFVDHWVVALAMITLLFVLSAMFFGAVFRRWFGTSSLFALLYLLLPINFEGAYWISASNRIVISLFLVSLTVWFLDRYIFTGHVWYIFAYFLCGVLCTGFYEQGLVLSVACSLLLMLFTFSGKFVQPKTKRAFAGLLSLGYAACYFLFISLQSGTGINDDRMVVRLPWDEGYWDFMFRPIADSIFEVGIKGTFLTYAKGFWRGCKEIVTSPNFVWCAVIFFALIALFFCIRVPEKRKHGAGGAVLYGVLIAAAPLLIFFFVGETPWFSCRNFLPALPGIALMLDALILLCVRRKHLVMQILCVLFAFGACIAGISETKDYRQTYLDDNTVVKAVLEAGAADDYGTEIKILNVSGSYLTDSNFMWNEHYQGATDSPWGMNGLFRYLTDTPASGWSVTPIPIDENGNMYVTWSNFRRITLTDHVYYYDPTTKTAQKVVQYPIETTDGTERFAIYDENGSYLATIVQTNEWGNFVVEAVPSGGPLAGTAVS